MKKYNNKKKYNLAIIFSILLFLTSCGLVKDGGVSDSFSTIHTGTEGLYMEFMKGSPPKEVYQNGLINFNIMLENKGAYGIKKGFLSFGYDEDYFELVKGEEKLDFTKDEKDNVLEGRSKENLKGERRFIVYQFKAKQIDMQSETHTSDFALTSCYEYQTTTTQQVCIDTNYYELKPIIEQCKVKDISLNSQGAPVALTKIEGQILAHADESKIKPQFVIYISNKGKGEVIDSDKVEDACSSSSLNYADINAIKISAFLGDKQLDCKPKKSPDSKEMEGYIKLKKDQDFVRCSFDEGISTGVSPYLTSLSVKMDYGYTFSESKEVMIKKERLY